MTHYHHLVDVEDTPPKRSPFYDDVCDDVVGHILGFLGDDEKAEWCHVNPTMLRYVVELDPGFRLLTCVRCGVYLKRCTCPIRRGRRSRGRWGACVVQTVLIGLLMVIIGATMLAVMGVCTGWR